jgi:cytochrome c oxidase subunit 3
MSAHAEPHAPGHHGGEHPPAMHLSSRVPQSVLGMLLFIGSETMLFGAFFAALFFVRVVNEAPHWPPTGYHLPIFVAGMNTIVLVTSSFTMHWSLSSIKKGDRVGMQAGLVLTILMGITFVVTQAREYSRIGFAPGDNAFATTFFGLTGLHGLHVIIGLLLLTAAAIRAFRGHFSPEHHHGLEIPGIYWHFVDVMWIIVFITVYIV